MFSKKGEKKKADDDEDKEGLSIKQDEERSFRRPGEKEQIVLERVDLLTLLQQEGEDVPDKEKTKRKKKVKSIKQELSEHVQRLTDEMMDRHSWKEQRTFSIVKADKRLKKKVVNKYKDK